MKIRTLFFGLVILTASYGCSTEVDLHADYKQVPIVYALLDCRADTNFIKITRSFYTQSDAYLTAANPDSCNYPGKLDARLVEYRNGDSLREIILDTITIRNKMPGTFYAPLQKLYYTTERLGSNTANQKFSYKLKVVLPDRVLIAQADLVGNNGFGMKSLGVNFSKEYIGKPPQKFLFYPAINAHFYEVDMAFTFLEQRDPDGDSVPRTMQWHVGTFMEHYLSTHLMLESYAFTYYPGTFYEKLSEFIGADTLVAGMKRYIQDYPIEVIITAGGSNLWHYVHTNNAANGFVSGETDFTLLDGAHGVFSSRVTTRRALRLAGETVPDLLAMTNYQFFFIGGRQEEE